jgi:hypothetical protein
MESSRIQRRQTEYLVYAIICMSMIFRLDRKVSVSSSRFSALKKPKQRAGRIVIDYV